MGFWSWLFGAGESAEPEITVEQAQREYSAERSRTAVSTGGRNLPYSISSLPSKYDDVKLDKMVGPHRVRTVGEYKDACQKFYKD